MKGFISKCLHICFPKKNEPDEVVIHAYPQLIFAWPLIALGFGFAFASAMGWGDGKAMAWIYITTVLSVLLTLGVDLNRNLTIFWLAVVALIWIGALWLQDVKGFTIFSKIVHYFGGLNPEYSPDMGLIIAIFLAVLFVLMIAKARLNDRWRFTHNEIEHCVYGQSDNAMARGAKRVTTNYPDILETIICGAGTITIYPAQGDTPLASIPHVPMLWFRMRKISRLLESVAISSGHEDDDLSEAEAEDIAACDEADQQMQQ